MEVWRLEKQSLADVHTGWSSSQVDFSLPPAESQHD